MDGRINQISGRNGCCGCFLAGNVRAIPSTWNAPGEAQSTRTCLVDRPTSTVAAVARVASYDVDVVDVYK